jgi:hypothetical protein
MLPVGYIILNKEIVESFRFPWFVYVVCSEYRLLPQVVKCRRGVFTKIGSQSWGITGGIVRAANVCELRSFFVSYANRRRTEDGMMDWVICVRTKTAA